MAISIAVFSCTTDCAAWVYRPRRFRTGRAGKSVTVSLTNGVEINDAKATTANTLAKNGVIHVVDTVLVPQ